MAKLTRLNDFDMNCVGVVMPKTLEDFGDLVVPILQDRVVYKHQYAHGPLRQKLFGRVRLPDTYPAAAHRGGAFQPQQSAAE